MVDQKGTSGHSETIYKYAEQLRMLEDAGGDFALLAQAIGDEMAKELHRIEDRWMAALPVDLKGIEP